MAMKLKRKTAKEKSLLQVITNARLALEIKQTLSWLKPELSDDELQDELLSVLLAVVDNERLLNLHSNLMKQGHTKLDEVVNLYRITDIENDN